jgi:hypothetical protein
MHSNVEPLDVGQIVAETTFPFVDIIPKHRQGQRATSARPSEALVLRRGLPFSNGTGADRQLVGAGYDQVDVQACTARNIKVSNTPAVVNDATADANMFLILGALRGFYRPMLTLREGQWRGNPLPPVGRDPRGKTLGILGMGGIGKNLKKKAEAFGMRVIYHNRTEDLAADVEYVSFEELLSTSDVISLNLPLNVSECLPQLVGPPHRQDAR